MGIEDRIYKLECKVELNHRDSMDNLCPRGLYSNRGWQGAEKKINPQTNEVLVALLDHLGLEPILAPENHVELRPKKEED